MSSPSNSGSGYQWLRLFSRIQSVVSGEEFFFFFWKIDVMQQAKQALDKSDILETQKKQRLIESLGLNSRILATPLDFSLH